MVELEGVKAIREAFPSNVYVVHLDIDEETLVKRLIKRKESILNFSNRLHLYREKEQYEHFKPYADLSIRNAGSLDMVTREVENFLLGMKKCLY